MDLSVIVVSWNTRAMLLACLASLKRHLGAWSYEVIVVDNDSADGSAEAVEAAFPAVQVIRSGANLGFAAGVNLGAAVARGRHLWLLNPDARLDHDAYAPLASRLARDPACGACGPLLRDVDGSVQRTANRFYAPDRSLVVNELTGPLLARLSGGRFLDGVTFDHATARPVDWLKGAALLIRREAWDAVGPLDERFFLYAEEIDWCKRAAAAGWTVWFEPAAEVVHEGGGASRVVQAWSLKQEQLARLQYIAKHHGERAAAFYRARTRVALTLRAGFARARRQPDATALSELATWYRDGLGRALLEARA